VRNILSLKREGYFEFETGRVWFELLGDDSGTPLIVVHGGPGLPHDYLEPLRELSATQPVLFYDQLGCGKSDHPEDNSLWQIDRFVDELAQIIIALDLKSYNLFGHSCGAIIALEYALGKPEGLKSLIFASPLFSTAQWITDINSYRDSLPDEVKEALERNEEAGTLDSKEFEEATVIFYQKHVCRLNPWPDSYVRAALGMGHSVYKVMWGPTEFICTGNLKSYDRVDHLQELSVPTLLTCGSYDGAKPNTISYYKSLIPNSEMKVFQRSAHMPHLEEPSLYLQTLQSFLNAVND
jgi:proline iminopeptidase